jgi:hypothetical protein
VGRPKRKITTFSLSFLDIMACGFGAVTLLFLILKHNPIANESANPLLVAEKNLLQEEIQVGTTDLVALRNSLKDIEESYTEALGLSNEALATIQEIDLELSVQSDPKQEIAVLKKEIAELQKKTQQLKEKTTEENTRYFAGDGKRQYLTGLKLGGKRIVILVDASASMLSDSIVNVIRRRNMSDESKRTSPKWQRAIKTTEWLIAQLPEASQYQIYTFSTSSSSINHDDGVWRNTGDKVGLDNSISQLKKIVPAGGTNLSKAFKALKSFNAPPDNIFLITDGLPTQGNNKQKNMTISGIDRMQLFQESLKELPLRVPINILLFPMEGDPVAAASYWRLAISTNGSFISPSRDWP